MARKVLEQLLSGKWSTHLARVFQIRIRLRHGPPLALSKSWKSPRCWLRRVNQSHFSWLIHSDNGPSSAVELICEKIEISVLRVIWYGHWGSDLWLKTARIATIAMTDTAETIQPRASLPHPFVKIWAAWDSWIDLFFVAAFVSFRTGVPAFAVSFRDETSMASSSFSSGFGRLDETPDWTWSDKVFTDWDGVEETALLLAMVPKRSSLAGNWEIFERNHYAVLVLPCPVMCWNLIRYFPRGGKGLFGAEAVICIEEADPRSSWTQSSGH